LVQNGKKRCRFAASIEIGAEKSYNKDNCKTRLSAAAK
jgi:hypothetical protein